MKKKNVLLCIVVLMLIVVLAMAIAACATKVSLTLNFIVDGKVYATVETDGQETIRMPADPKKDGATFEGWYWDEGIWLRPFTADSLLETPLTSNVSVYAKFRTEEDVINTELRLDGFSLIETEELGKAYYISLPNSQLIFDIAAAVTIDNRATWSLSVDLYGNHTIASKRVDLEVGDNIYYILVQNQYGKSEQYILLMRRRPIYAVTFDTGAGTYCLPQMVEEGEYATAPTTTRVGYTFFCWDYDFDKPIVKNTVVTAIWAVNSYTITYNANGGTCVSSQKVTYDRSTELATPTRDGYTFVGWLLDGQPFDENRYEQKWTIAKDITLVAQWSAKSYDIYYNLGCDTQNNNPTTYKVGEEITLNSVSRTGYTFNGWREGNNFYSASELPIQIDLGVGNKTFDADWTAKTYTITLNSDGGDCPESELTVKYDEYVSLPLCTKLAYTFGGWYYQEKRIDNGTWKIDDDITLTARWKANSDTHYTVNHYTENLLDEGYTLRLSEDLQGTTDSVVYSAVQAFDGFSAPSVEELKILPDGSAVLDYYYSRNSYTITFAMNGGNEISPITQKYESAITIPETGVRDGFTFGGWFADVALSEEFADTTMQATNKTVYAWWREETKPIDLNFSCGYTSATIYGYKGSDTTLRIPSYIGNLPVTYIYSCSGSNLTKVFVPDTVTSISSGAFRYCSALEEITLPFVGESENGQEEKRVLGYIFGYKTNSSLNNVEGAVFQCSHRYSSGLTEYYYYYIPKTLQKVTITTQTKIPANAFYNCDFIEHINIPGDTTSIGEYAFDNCKNLSTLNSDIIGTFAIPQNITIIPDDCFYQCVLLQTVTIGNVESIGSYAFYGCSNLTSFNTENAKEINIPEGAVKISSYVFQGATLITKVIVPDTVTSIGSGVFAGCAALEEITLPFVGKSETSQSSESLFKYIFGTIPNTIRKVTITKQTEIPANAFQSCDFIEHINIPEDTTSIGEYAFINCKNLSTLNSETAGTFAIPQGVATISNFCFYNCSLVERVITCSIESIGFSAFNGCSKLTSFNSENVNEINIPEGTTKISDHAFQGATLITKVIVPNTVTSIGDGAFNGCSALEEITLPFVGKSEETQDKASVFGYIFGYASSSNGVHQHYDYYYILKTIRKVTITKQTEIPAHAFQSCDFIEHITIPEDATSIGEYAFYNCKKLFTLNSETAGTFAIPQNVAVIPDNCFYQCALLQTATMGNIESIGINAFYNCSSLTSFNTENVNEITIPTGTTKIGYSAFQGVSLIAKVIVPDTVTNIGSGVFAGCAALEEITLPFVGKSETSQSSESLFKYIFGTIPNTIRKVTITKQTEIPANAFQNCDFIEHITIPEEVTSIGSYAFYNCKNLSTLNSETAGTFAIPQGVVGISNYCFRDCALIERVTTGSIESIGYSAFQGCSKLTSFNAENEIRIPDTVTSIGDGAFKECSSIVEITLPFVGAQEKSSSVTGGVFGYIFGTATSSYGVNQYSNNYYGIPKTIRNVTITKQTEIPAYAFKNCDFIEHIIIPQGATSIGTNAFYNCSKLSTLNSETAGTLAIPQGVTTISDSCFYNCSLLTNVNVLNNITIGTNAFYGTGISKQLGLVYIGNYLYKYNGTMPTDYILGVRKGTTDIYADALKDCTGLKKVILPEGFKAIHSGAFSGCTNLSEIVFSETLETIESQAFNKCSKLSTLTIPNSVTSIASSAFSGCSGLTELTLPFVGKSSETWGTFSSIFGTVPSSLKTVTITGNGTLASSAFSGCSYLTSITFTGTVDGVGASAFKGCSSLQTILLPTVTTLGENAFQNCSKLGTISMPAVMEIGAYAFDGCSLLTTVDFGQESPLTSIGTYAFRNCKALQSITIPSGVTAIADNTFYGCNHLEEITLSENTESIGVGAFQNCTALTKINIPASVVTIMREAFKGCSTLQTVTIQGAGLQTIDAYAFQNCAALESIYLKTSVQTIGEYAFDGCTALQIYCEAEQIPDGWDFNWNPDELPVTWNHKEN